MSNNFKVNMSKVENITADIDNNVQKTPKGTPSKRLTSSERARIESELLVKALGGSLEGGRRTRSSTRGSAAPSPIIQEPVKRKAPATPKRTKKVKANIVDEIDAGHAVQDNHIPQNASDYNNAQAALEEQTTTKPVESKVMMIKKGKEAIEIVSETIKIRTDQKMDIDPVDETKDSQESVPSIQQPIDESITITIDSDSLNASPEASNEPTPSQTEAQDDKPDVVADTTMTVILEEIDSDASESQKNHNNKNSPNDDVTIIITSPSKSVSPSNEPSQSEPDNDAVKSSDVVPIEGIVEVNDDDDDDDDTNGNDNDATIEAKTQIVDRSVTENEIEIIAGNNNTDDHSNDVEIVQDIVASTNNETLSERIEADKKKSDVTVAVNSSMEADTITKTSKKIVEPSTATTVGR